MDDAMVSAVCKLFDLGAPRGAPTPIAGGLTHRMWRLESARGVYAVKQINRDFDDAGYIGWYERAFALEQAAFGAGISMPRPIPVAGTDRCLAELPDTGERPTTVRVHEWVEGAPLEGGVVHAPGIIEGAGGMLGRIHGLAMKSDVTAEEALRIFGPAHWGAYAQRATLGGLEWAAGFEQSLPYLETLEAYVAEAHQDKTWLLLSHRDSDQKNHMRTPGDGLVLVDWDAAGPVNPRQDLANHALVWAGVHAREPDAAAARAYIAAYRRVGGLREEFRHTDLAELVALRLGWLDFNVRRALGERARDDADIEAGERVVQRNFEHLPRFVRSLDGWLVILRDV